jgi:wingless-type MMTV integration site family, member 11
VYALSSASVAHIVARACADGALVDCPCGATPRSPPDGNFKWGGCGDNVAYGVKVSKKFLERLERGKPERHGDEVNEMHLENAEQGDEKRRSRHLLAHVNKHNNRAGRRVCTFSIFLCTVRK